MTSPGRATVPVGLSSTSDAGASSAAPQGGQARVEPLRDGRELQGGLSWVGGVRGGENGIYSSEPAEGAPDLALGRGSRPGKHLTGRASSLLKRTRPPGWEITQAGATSGCIRPSKGSTCQNPAQIATHRAKSQESSRRPCLGQTRIWWSSPTFALDPSTLYGGSSCCLSVGFSVCLAKA